MERIQAADATGGLSRRSGGPIRRRPLCSIVIPTYNGRELLARCLASIERHRPDPIALSDRGRGRRQRLDRRHVRMAGAGASRASGWCGSSRTASFCAAANAGLAAARGAFVQLLNNDTEVTAGWVEAGLAPFADETVGSVAPLVLVRSDPDRVDSAGDSLRLVRLADEARPRAVGRALGGATRSRRSSAPAARSAFYRAEALRRAGTLDLLLGQLLRGHRPGLPAAMGRLSMRLRPRVA